MGFLDSIKGVSLSIFGLVVVFGGLFSGNGVIMIVCIVLGIAMSHTDATSKEELNKF